MPMVEHEASFRIEGDLDQVRIWEIVEARVTLVVECVSCHRRTTWPPDLLRGRLNKTLGRRLCQVAGRFRCAACRSRFVRIWRDGAKPAAAELRPEPGLKRGFTAANLDANARGGARLPAWQAPPNSPRRSPP